MQYFWETPAWPNKYTYDPLAAMVPLGSAREVLGSLLASLQGIGFSLRQNLAAEALAVTAVETSKIEGELVDLRDARSSVARRLGLATESLRRNRQTDGLADILIDAVLNPGPLTPERLFGWHRSLFIDSNARLETVGNWRKCPMNVIFGPIGREKVHFEAPPAERVPDEMATFLDWYNGTHRDDAIVVAAQAHLYFETIHPFEDGNGRIGRALTDNMLARAAPGLRGAVSMANVLASDRRAYQAQLEAASRNPTGNSTDWVVWHTSAYREAMTLCLDAIQSVLAERRFWSAHSEVGLSDRQHAMIKKFLDPDFAGTIRAAKYATLAKVSVDTAQRDLASLVEKGFLVRNPGQGRRTSYSLDHFGNKGVLS